MADEKVQGELKQIKFGDKLLTVYRRCSCGGQSDFSACQCALRGIWDQLSNSDK